MAIDDQVGDPVRSYRSVSCPTPAFVDSTYCYQLVENAVSLKALALRSSYRFQFAEQTILFIVNPSSEEEFVGFTGIAAIPKG